MSVGYRDVLAFWFGTPGEVAYGEPRATWFNKDPAVDETIRQRFRALHLWANNGLLDPWDEAADSALALIIVLDQFSRQLYRDDARAFKSDARALQLAENALEQGFDRAVLPVQRVFFYLPFEHAESDAAQARSVALFEQLASESPTLAPFADYARRHREVISRFGRFPHRNATLGRDSSADEIAYLATPGAGF